MHSCAIKFTCDNTSVFLYYENILIILDIASQKIKLIIVPFKILASLCIPVGINFLSNNTIILLSISGDIIGGNGTI